MTPAGTAAVVRRRIAVRGAVQGVGFRPFAFRLAEELGLAGFVGNDDAGAFAEVEGPADAVRAFERRLRADAPPLARVDAIEGRAIAPRGDGAFAIVRSQATGAGRTLVPPDVATCDACLAELADPADRRHRHPFITCTDCGPRFTIIRALPYDRPQTTMAGFPLCPACAAEYADPRDRRYHAQPIACPDCGPVLLFEDATGAVAGTDAAIAAVHAAWARGAIVAVKGIGGYHLTCDAASDAALALLRARKGRDGKPFALLVADVGAARRLVELDAAEAEALASPARPIVLARRRADAPVAALVAPGSPDLGVLLAYSALHHLLLAPVPGGAGAPPAAIVATSGNRAGEPICTDDADARARLGDLADAFLVHDRPIHLPCDDSVVRVEGGRVRPIRRSRGYAPLPVALPAPVRPTLAVGGDVKGAFCLAADGSAWLSQHVGDLENVETLDALGRSVAQFRAMYGIEPEVVATDAHPGYRSRRFALDHAGAARVVEVQHHHAHVAALMAEHGLAPDARVIGLVLDGTGFGAARGGGAAIWGCEVLLAGYAGAERVGHLGELPLPGGDGAVANPCRIALGYLAACGLDPDARLGAVRAAEPVERAVVARQVEAGIGTVPTTSAGRLFDAAASLLDVCHRATYEAQAAIELEALALRASRAFPLPLAADADGVLDPAPLLAALVDGALRGRDRAGLALGFHHALADALVARAAAVAEATGVRTVGLSGGVFQNRLLAARCRERLAAHGLAVLEHRLVPANDGGIALGQAIVAGLGHGHCIDQRRG